MKVLCVIKKKLSNTSNFLNIRDQKNPEMEEIIQEGEASDVESEDHLSSEDEKSDKIRGTDDSVEEYSKR